MPATLSSLHDSVQAVRQFNRFYTRQIGVLQEHLLESRFSLTEVRVLYELAHRQNVTAVELRENLGLDRGYLSRMLQRFEKNGWIKTTPSRSDARKVMLALTGRGRHVFAPLDRRSSEEVAAMLARLSPGEQKKLLEAMSATETILGSKSQAARETGTDQDGRPIAGAAETYTLRRHQPGDMGWVVQRHGELYWQEYQYDERFEALVAQIAAEFVQNFDAQQERCWIAEKDGQRAGTIFLVKKSATVAKLRLLLVEPSARSLGIGKRLVSECVSFAREAGYKKVVLWTQSELRAARHLYKQAGFVLTSKKRHQSWGRKNLVAEVWELKL